MSLWMHWWNAIWRLRPAFSRLQTFLWFATAVAGFTVRTELLGVTSIVRALKAVEAIEEGIVATDKESRYEVQAATTLTLTAALPRRSATRGHARGRPARAPS